MTLTVQYILFHC